MIKKPKFEFYTRPTGKNEFIEFLQSLPIKDKQKLLAIINMVQEHGLLVAQRMEWVKKVDNFHVTDERYIITHGFTKKTQRTPVNEIKHAKVLKKEFEENNNG